MILIGCGCSHSALLIFYHIGMFYVSWDWHIKSTHANSWAEPAMLLLNPWRLPLLFLISGMAIRFAIDKSDLVRFTAARFWRLSLPILFGLLVIVVPQSWLQLIESGETQLGLIDFYRPYLNGELSISTPTWNHLWYVVYILLYTMFLVPFARPASSLMSGAGERLSAHLFGGRYAIASLLLIPFIPQMIYRVFLDAQFPTTHDVVTDWANHAHSFTWFLFGFLLAKDKNFWNAIARGWRFAGIIAVLCAVWLSMTWENWDQLVKDGHNLWPARAGRVMYIWLVVLTLLGFAQRYLNTPSKALVYMTKAVFAWYILHQSLIIVAGYWLTRQGLPVAVEFMAVTGATIAGCLILEVLVRKSIILRPLFGMRLVPTTRTRS